MPAIHSSHRIEPHVGELRIVLHAASLAALFEEAARALAEVVAGGADESGDSSDESERVTLSAPDREALLVDWLNELIYLSETRRRIFDRARVLEIGDDTLIAEVRGRPAAGARTLVKAATFHDLQIRADRSGLSATVLLDI